MATFDAWRQQQGPALPTSPYLSPQLSAELGIGYPTPIMGMEMPPGQSQPGFSPAPYTPPGGIADGSGSGLFDRWLATVNAGRPAAAQPDPFAGMGMGQAPAPEAPFHLSAQGGPSIDPGMAQPGATGAMPDRGQMAREMYYRRKFPRAMQRIDQLRLMSQRRGY